MAETVATLPLQRKVSRYRAQRIPAATEAPPLPTQSQGQVSPPTDPLQRSRSRYRHARSGTEHVERLPTIPQVPSEPAKTEQQRLRSRSRSASAAARHVVAQAPPPVPHVPNGQIVREVSHPELSPRYRAQSGSRSRGLQREPSTEHFSPPRQTRRVGSRTTLDGPASPKSSSTEKKSPPVQASIAQVTRSPPPVGELFPPPRPQSPPKLDGPPSSSQIRATKAIDAIPEDKTKGIGGLFRRKRGQTLVEGEQNDTPEVVPLPDEAPVSAVNAGERRVLMECGTYKMMYPVTPTTTPVDLIKSAAITMSNPINPKSAVLLEYFTTVGVHRAIRRYEHVRDVMNSWDSDDQNSLLLIDPGTSSSETELGLTAVPKVKPAGGSWQMYFSQVVGKWEKRIVHLKKDGQITVQKDPKKPSDQTNVCHLSDFDIYTPTQEKIKKKIRPPKKHCYAVKSQQKSSMFENTTNFVHFFCTADKAVGDQFYAAVQSWRSWYLVNVLGEGAETPAPVASRKRGDTIVSKNARAAHHRMDSVDSHYELGTFTPLVDLDLFGSKRQSADVTPALRSPIKNTSDLGYTRDILADDEPLFNLARRQSQESHRASLSRSGTQRRTSAEHRPLVGLARNTSVSRNGTGYQRPPSLDKGLVAMATGPNVQEPEYNGRMSIDQAHHAARGSRTSFDSFNGFTGEGLLAQSQAGWGDGKKGRGVIDGSRANGPMVDLGDESQFVKGSLLQRVERREGPRGPIIDREKKVERHVYTGERF